MHDPMRSSRRTRTSPKGADFELPAHWSPTQALAVFECVELLRDQLWSAYGPQIQQAWREQLLTEQATPNPDPDSPF